MKLEKLFNPQSLVIVGASEEEGKVGNIIAKNILELGYAGEVFLVNAKHDSLFERKCYARIADIECAADLAIVAVPAKYVNEVVREGAAKVKNFVIVSAGFGEIGGEGKARETELEKIAQENNLNILGPNCLGFINPKIKLNASFAGGLPPAGNVSLVSQSGALVAALMDAGKKENMKFSHIISAGNKMQTDETDLLEFLDGDADTKVIGMYLEGIKDGKRFLEIAKKISKSVVVLKAGKTEKAQKAISSHTGALAGSDEIMSAAFAQAGILRADNLGEFFDLLNLISSVGVPPTNKAVIVTNAGGPGVLTADAFGKKIIKPAELSESVKAELRQFLPAESSVENPVDLLGDAREDRYARALAAIEKDETVGAVICVLTPQNQTPVLKIAEAIVEFKNKTSKAVAAVFIGGEKVEAAIAKLEANDVPNFSFPERAVAALDKYYYWGFLKKYGVTVDAIRFDNERKSQAQSIIRKAKAENRQALLFPEARKIMELYGISTVKTFSLDAKDIEFPVVVKVDSDKVLHKTDRQGVILNIKNEEDLKAAFQKMESNFPGESIIIQPMLERQTELILGIKRDSVFGPVAVYGLGGIYAEVFRRVDFLIPPLDKNAIRQHLEKSQINFLIKETRGQKGVNAEELAGILEGLLLLALENEEVLELDINPLLVYNDGKASVAVDVKIVI